MIALYCTLIGYRPTICVCNQIHHIIARSVFSWLVPINMGFKDSSGPLAAISLFRLFCKAGMGSVILRGLLPIQRSLLLTFRGIRGFEISDIWVT